MKTRTLMEDILVEGGLEILFQPIVDVTNGGSQLFAIEALARGPKGSNVERADVLFEYVRRKGKELEVDRACLRAALRGARTRNETCAISINVHAATLERDDQFIFYLLEQCAAEGIAPETLILEIVEEQKYSDHLRFFRAVDALRATGVRVALDDIGLGYSNYRTLIELRPDFYKIDRYFITGCGEKDNARAAIESIALLADRLNGRVIAEGVESQEDLATVTALGVDLVQGYHFGRPSGNGSTRGRAHEPQEDPAGR